MDEQMMEKRVRKYLQPGEEICWRGKTEAFDLFSGEDGRKLLGREIAILIVEIILLILYFRAYKVWNDGIVGLIVVMAAGFMLGPVLERRNLLAQRYWMTDRRAILQTRSGDLYFLDLAEVDHIQPIRDCLVMSRAKPEDWEQQLRWRSCHPQTEERNRYGEIGDVGMVFYRVADIENLVSKIRAGA